MAGHNHLVELAQDVVRLSLAAGATGAECTISEGDEFSANIRMREIESVKEAGSRGMGLRILRGRYTGSSHTSDCPIRKSWGRWPAI
jgi:PmbA protein